MRKEINLDGKMTRRVPDPPTGRYAFLEAIPLAFGIFVLLRYGASLSIWVAKTYFEWQVAPISGEYTAVIMFVGALFLSVLIGAAGERAKADRDANGVITTTFRLIAHGVNRTEGGKEVLRTLAALAWATHHFYRREAVVVLEKGREFQGSFPVVYALLDQLDALDLRTERKLEFLNRAGQMLDALGGIASRRTYRILKSRFVNNILFISYGIFLMLLAVLTGSGNWLLGQITLLVFTYGATSVFLVIMHLGDGIGYDPGDINPYRSLSTWLEEIDAACENAWIKEKDRPWQIEDALFVLSG